MSAIVGFYGLDERPTAADDLASMIAAVAHRGTDGSAVWLNGQMGLGHLALHTTPESRSERLPMERNGLVVTADARIDNRDELIAALRLGCRPASESTDSEIILSAYQEWGEACPGRLLGDFSFVIWDSRRRLLFCARDCFGARPFHYYHVPGRFFAFASEIKALLCLPDVPRRINETRIGDYLMSLPTDKAMTFYEDVFRLAPAHSMTVDANGLRLRQYWSPDPARTLELKSDQEYAEAYLDVFRQAVRSRLRVAVPIGSALSGGLDSSSIVCVARELLAQDGKPSLKTFSGVFDEVLESDERPYINSVVEQGGLDPHFVRVDQISPLVDLEQVLWHLEEPIWTPNLFMHWGLYTAAQSHGVRVFLDGFLGDNIVGHGWEYLMDLAFSWRWVKLLREIDGIAMKQAGFSKPRMVWRYFADFSVKQRLHEIWGPGGASHGSAAGPSLRVPPVVNPEFAKRIALKERIAALAPPQVPPPDAARKRHLRDLTAGELPLGLEISNKIASAFAIEPRFPFADRRMAEFCLATPPEQRIHHGLSRMIVRRALAHHLPEKVCWRSGKGDLSHNIARRLLDFEGSRLDDLILGDSGRIEPYCDIVALRRTYRRYSMRPNGTTIQALWAPLNLALWLGDAPQSLVRRGGRAV